MVSNRRMENHNDTESRLTALEEKASYHEDLLDKLDQVIIRQQDQIDQLVRELVHLRNQAPETGSAGRSSPRDELPPHY